MLAICRDMKNFNYSKTKLVVGYKEAVSNRTFPDINKTFLKNKKKQTDFSHFLYRKLAHERTDDFLLYLSNSQVMKTNRSSLLVEAAF